MISLTAEIRSTKLSFPQFFMNQKNEQEEASSELKLELKLVITIHRKAKKIN